MPKLPALNEQATQRRSTDVFMGYNHRLKIADGEFYDTGNLTTSYYPLLASRRKRGLVREFENFQGMTTLNDKLAYVDKQILYYDGQATPVTGLSAGEKQLIPFGAYICIFPDNMFYNTVDSTDYGKMASVLNVEGAALEYRMSNIDGVEYGTATKSETAPESPSDGQLWIDTKYTKLYQYSVSTTTWVNIETVYTKIIFPAQSVGNRPSDRFKKLDGVTISGSSIDGINGSKILYAVGENYIVVVGVLDNVLTQSDADISICQTIPKMDFVIECQNRLWGCYYGQSSNGTTINEIYCCVLGDFRNWNRFMGISTDAYVASVGTEGPWTGAINYLGYPTFFKENFIHRVSVSAAGAHQIMDTPARGVQKGSAKSLAIINETLYYKSREEVCAYQGGFPSGISQALGELKYSGAVGGALGDKYYLCMRDSAGVHSLFVIDTVRGLWIREDDLSCITMMRSNGELYAASGNKLYAMTGTEGTPEASVNWFAESGILYYEYPDKKYISRFNLRLKMERSSRLKIFIEYDSDGTWRPSGEIYFSGTGTVTVPVRPCRCDHMRLRLEGKGMFRLFSMARILEIGSDY